MEADYDYYEILQVSPEASKEVIDSAFRALQKSAHPDKGGLNKVSARLNEAHNTLSNPEKRATYDRNRKNRPTKEKIINDAIIHTESTATTTKRNVNYPVTFSNEEKKNMHALLFFAICVIIALATCGRS